MAVQYRTLSRDYILKVSTTDGGPYTTVSGVNNMTWAKDTNTQEVNPFANRGLSTDVPTSSKLALEVEAYHEFSDDSLDTRDAGQLILANAAAQYVNGAIVYVELTHVVASGSLTFPAYASTGESGGGADDFMMMNVTLSALNKPVGTGHFSKQFGSTD